MLIEPIHGAEDARHERLSSDTLPGPEGTRRRERIPAKAGSTSIIHLKLLISIVNRLRPDPITGKGPALRFGYVPSMTYVDNVETERTHKRLKLHVKLTFVVVLAPLMLAGCGSHTGSGSASPIFLDAVGQCPTQPAATSPSVCQRSRNANAVAGIFKTRYTPWGYSYSFNCGQRAGDFFVVVGIPTQDGQLPLTEAFHHARIGSGYQLVSRTTTTESLAAVPTIYRNPENVQLLTTCAWHIRAVVGLLSAVKAAVPPIPRAVNAGIARQKAVSGR